MSQLGHTDAGFTLRVYAHAMRRDEGDKERLKALVEGRDWAPLGTSAPLEPPQTEAHQQAANDESPANARLSDDGRGGFRTCDLSRVKQRRTIATGGLPPANRTNPTRDALTETSLIGLGSATFGPTNDPTVNRPLGALAGKARVAGTRTP
jgi:hypothetical protein